MNARHLIASVCAALLVPAAFGYDLHTKALTPIVEKAKPAGGTMKFVENGELNFAIVGDFGAERTTNTRSGKSIAPAADFLVEAFEKTTGRRPPVLDARKDAEKIAAAKYWLLVGDSKYVREQTGLDWTKMPEHGYEIRTFPRGIAIVGFDSSLVDGWHVKPLEDALTSPGTQYGALDFCERFLGVRHFFPGEYGSLWPKCTDLAIAPVHYADEPYFDTHGNTWHYWVTTSTDEKAAKWRAYMGDGIGTRDTSFVRYWRQGSRKRMQGSHCPEPISYAAAHPDRMRDIFYTSPSGRFWYNPKEHVGNYYDVTNLKFADLLVEDWKAFYATDGRHRPGKIHEGANAGGVSFGVCDTYMPLADMLENPTVKKLGLIRDEELKGIPAAAMRNVYGRFFQYLGNRLKKELPGKELWLLVYYNSLYAPTDPRWKLPDNIRIWLCMGDIPGRLDDPDYLAKKLQIAKEWYEARDGRPAEEMWLYNHPTDPFQQAIVPGLSGGVPKAFGKYFGRGAIFFDWSSGANDLWHNFEAAYALEKAQWNPGFDAAAALDEMAVPFYGGKAAPHIRAFRRILREMYAKYAVRSSNLAIRYPLPLIDALERELEAAKAATAPDSPEGRRVRLVADNWPRHFASQRARAKSELPVCHIPYVATADELRAATPVRLADPQGDAADGVTARLGWNEKGLFGHVEAKAGAAPDVELFLSPGLGKAVDYRIRWDAAGRAETSSQRMLPVVQPPDRTWKAEGAKFKARDAAAGRTADFFVPFSAFAELAVRPYDHWFGNLVVGNLSTSVTNGDNADRALWGYLRFAGRGELPPAASGKSISVGNALNTYTLRSDWQRPSGNRKGELRMTTGNTMGGGFTGLVNWLKIEVNGIRSGDLVVQPGEKDAFHLNFNGAKVKVTPYMRDGSPILRCRLEPDGGPRPIESCRVILAAVPSKLGKADGKVMFSGNARRIVRVREDAWVLLDDVFDGTSEEKGFGPCAVFADMGPVADVKESAGSSWVAEVSFDLKPGFKSFEFGIFERDRVRRSNDEFLKDKDVLGGWAK